MRSTPLIVNLFGAPGSGKSTARAGAFYLAKSAGIEIEEVTEFAKDLTWEKRQVALACQPYVFGKQLRNMERLFGQIDVLISDSPVILSSFYGRKYCANRYPSSFWSAVDEHFKLMATTCEVVNFWITRVKPYNPKGRNQTETEAVAIAAEMRAMLMAKNIPTIELPGDQFAPHRIVEEITRRLALSHTCPHGGIYSQCPDCP